MGLTRIGHETGSKKIARRHSDFRKERGPTNGTPDVELDRHRAGPQRALRLDGKPTPCLPKNAPLTEPHLGQTENP